MHLTFDDGVTIKLSTRQKKHFTLFKDISQMTNSCELLTLNDVESNVFKDLLELHNLSENTNPTGWLAQKILHNRCGYIRDLFMLNLFLNSECKQVEALFEEIFCYILSDGSDGDVKEFFGI